jgi:hypothetical protein
VLLALQLNNLLEEAAELVEVPDVVGQTQAEGSATLEGAGFAVSVTYQYSDSVPEGEIISQQPLGGAEAAEGSTVGIVVSGGPRPAEEEQQASGGWGFLNLYEAELNRRRRLEKRRKELEAETEQIPNTTDREIAEFFRHQERLDEKRAELDALAELVKDNDDLDEAREYSEEVARAYVEAFLTGNRKAVAELDKELQKALEDEEFLLMVLMAMH